MPEVISNMATETIVERIKSLRESDRRQVLDFVEFISFRRARPFTEDEDLAWSSFSLASAMRGMEREESPYTLDDIKEFFT